MMRLASPVRFSLITFRLLATTKLRCFQKSRFEPLLFFVTDLRYCCDRLGNFFHCFSLIPTFKAFPVCDAFADARAPFHDLDVFWGSSCNLRCAPKGWKVDILE